MPEIRFVFLNKKKIVRNGQHASYQLFFIDFFYRVDEKLVMGEWVNSFPNKSLFLHVCSTSLLKTLCEKEKLLLTSNFSNTHSVLFPFYRPLYHFHQFQNCCRQILSVWKILNSVVLERVYQLRSLWKFCSCTV